MTYSSKRGEFYRFTVTVIGLIWLSRVSGVSKVVWLGLVLGLGLVSVIGLGVVVTSLGVSSYSTSGPLSTGMGDRLRRTNHLSISPSHPGQLSLLPSAGRGMSTSQSAVMLCGWGVKAGMVHSTCG